MSQQITISTINGGTEPYFIYLCDENGNNCIYIDTITSAQIPFNFIVPSIYESLPNKQIKVIPTEECPPVGPTPTPSPTPTATPIPCYCYLVDAPYQTTISWTDCDGVPQEQKVTASLFYLCAQVGTVTTTDVNPLSASTISGGTTICTLETDCWPISGCTCYTWTDDGGGSGYVITYYDCDGNLQTQPVNGAIDPVYSVCGYNAYVGELVGLTSTISYDCEFNGTEYICPETFTLFANDLTTARLHQIVSTSGYTVDWGDGFLQNFSAGSNIGAQHTYSSPFTPYTGEIKILSGNLGSLKTFRTDFSIGTGGTNPSLLVLGSELYKLSGLTYFGNVYSTFSGNTTEVPVSLQTFYSLKGKLTGDLSNLPNTLKSLTLGGYENNNLTGNVNDFPSGMTYIFINGGTNTIEGDVKDIPSGVTYFGIWGNNTISGNTADIDDKIANFYLYGFNTLKGDIANMPTSASSFVVYGYNSLSGDVASISGNTTIRTLVVANPSLSPTGNTITGDINNIPKKIDTLELRGNNTIYGDIVNMPTGSTATSVSQYFNLAGQNTVSGQASDISVHVSDFFLSGLNKLSGNTIDFPSNIEVMWIGGLNEITGDIANLPPNVYNVRITGPNTIKDYTAGRTWVPDMNDVTIIPSSSGTNFLSTAEVDNLMIDLTGTTWSFSPRFGSKQITVVGTASTVSSAARIKLSGSTPTGYGISLTLL